MKRNVQNTKFQTPNTNKGITLVALVITIIILLILAGVAINMAINSDGLFGEANEATGEWNESVKEEKTELVGLLDKLDKVSPTPVEISTTIPTGWEEGKVEAVAKGLNGNVPIPTGYVASKVSGEDTIAGGLVIYKKENGITEVTSVNHKDALEQCDQYVWIPVNDINSMVMCKSNNKDGDGTVCKLELKEDLTKENEEERYYLLCTTHNSTDLAGRLYYSTVKDNASDVTPNKIRNRKIDFLDKKQQYISNSDYREPDNLIDTSGGDSNSIGISAIKEILQTEGKIYEGTVTYETIKDDWLSLQQADYDSMAESVARYGGFYISRYEVGVGGISKKNKDVLENTSDSNNWWGMYSILRTAETPMIWGSQYDQVIKFIGEQAQFGHIDRNLAKNSTSKSGLNELDLMRNIYDLEGNLKEWTAEASGILNRLSRGGSYKHIMQTGDYLSASFYSSNWPANKKGETTTRSTINL